MGAEVQFCGINYSALTGICVGAGTIAFFLLFQKGGPLSSVPAILAGGAAIMAIAGILFFQGASLVLEDRWNHPGASGLVSSALVTRNPT